MGEKKQIGSSGWSGGAYSDYSSVNFLFALPFVSSVFRTISDWPSQSANRAIGQEFTIFFFFFLGGDHRRRANSWWEAGEPEQALFKTFFEMPKSCRYTDTHVCSYTKKKDDYFRKVCRNEIEQLYETLFVISASGHLRELTEASIQRNTVRFIMLSPFFSGDGTVNLSGSLFYGNSCVADFSLGFLLFVRDKSFQSLPARRVCREI